MKKFMKTCGILALVMILAGIVMIAVPGIVKGPEVIRNMKQSIANGLNKLDSGVRFNVDSDMNFDSDYPVISGSSSQTFSVADIKSMEAEVGTCQMNILPSDDEDFHVSVENAGSYQGYVSDGTLYLKTFSSTGIGVSAGESEINLDLQVPSCRIDLYVPADFYFEEARLLLGAGAISGTALLKADDLEIKLAAGEINLTSLEVNALNAEVGAGTLDCKGSILENADVICGMGEIKLELWGTKTDFNYDLEVAAGDVTIDRESFGGIAGKRNISNNNASKDIKVECAMGSVDITFVN